MSSSLPVALLRRCRLCLEIKSERCPLTQCPLVEPPKDFELPEKIERKSRAKPKGKRRGRPPKPARNFEPEIVAALRSLPLPASASQIHKRLEAPLPPWTSFRELLELMVERKQISAEGKAGFHTRDRKYYLSSEQREAEMKREPLTQ